MGKKLKGATVGDCSAGAHPARVGGERRGRAPARTQARRGQGTGAIIQITCGSNLTYRQKILLVRKLNIENIPNFNMEFHIQYMDS